MMGMTKGWLGFLRQQFPRGSRIQLIEMTDPYHPVEPGTMGTLEFIDDAGTFHMRWDDGRSLGLAPGEDQFTIFPGGSIQTAHFRDMAERIKAASGPSAVLEEALLEEACRQWYAFIQESPERSDGEGFAGFYREICQQLLNDPGFMENFRKGLSQEPLEMGGLR